MNTTPTQFIAWNKRENIMCYSNEDNDKSYWDGVYLSTLDLINSRLDYDSYKYEWMQLTALTSINDEPIYNHMIVKDAWEKLHVIDMHRYCKMAYLSTLQKLEIVGNRFQNPELLEAK